MKEQKKIDFLKSILPQKILQHLNRGNDEILSTTVSTPEHLDGFMSTIHKLEMTVKNSKDREESFNLMVKVMKGDDAFRERSKAIVQFSNEIFIYTEVLPQFTELLQSSGSSIKGDSWCPKVFYGAAGKFPEYSDQYETILVMEDMKLNGFEAGPRNDLDESHLTLMVKKIAQFHACTYAMKVNKDKNLDRLIEGIKPLEFVEGGKEFHSYAVLTRLGLERVLEYIDKHPKELDSESFKCDMTKLRDKYGKAPVHLMQKLLERDEYSVILHGDYNRNNVLFKYKDGKPVDLRMFDFQENRYATPAIDLAFFMCMSMPTGMRERLWDPLLRQYHESMTETLITILKCKPDDEKLKPYTFENFMQHFQRFGLYGGMIASHFLPWMLCPEDECAQLAYYFAKDMDSPEMKHWTMVCGGEAVDKRLVEIFRHLSQLGYFAVVHND
ncbi:uncharacterized protein LOC128742295 isoform X2 [Sabethes cyaneus]|uniref:uncharacterized protein LOC128742295 isoform X2 n=1 Tax=Sabethes cyaneus TaxID=53552 RepID=UPI00237EDEA6|nr:uncharacterized protein LOC128742295 isoform X2 [Sabethes cyaneus]